MKTFKVTWKRKVVQTRTAFVNAETEREARNEFDDGMEYDARTLSELDPSGEAHSIEIKEVTKDCGCTNDAVCGACIPF